MNTARPKGGFSMPELIVVLGLIMLLISLLMPAVSRARRQAMSVQCRAQLRDLGMALAAYANENRGCVVPFRGWAPGPRWPELAYDDPQPAVLICPTGAGQDFMSYQLNKWMMWGEIRLQGNNAAGLPASRMVLAGESWLGRYEEFSSFDHATGATSWDPARHGPGLMSNYLWLDFHVDNDPPRPIPPSRDPWWIPI